MSFLAKPNADERLRLQFGKHRRARNEVVVERVDVNAMNGVAVTFYVTAFFGVRDGAITYWREYWDTTHVAQQLGIDPALMFAPLNS
ncbi:MULTISPECIES: limonene-1,2-epoxide hydrolase family protein [unclassified Mycobacterium]|uniref:limonene-1,2-epoxide hydrolase family protein n=1 Tax=unclassified Mycobacterium TaxID=2642494 RepID=UPI001E321149|nr:MULTISPECIES: limonene-1,2-epoxide hydrolase family protein [unclassified Mycobacterium]